LISLSKWRIIFYDHLHPKEPRCYAEIQFTNKRICIFTKHKRYNRLETVETIYHEILHLIFHSTFGERRSKPLDYIIDWVDYNISKLINLKTIVKEKGWVYFKTSRRKYN